MTDYGEFCVGEVRVVQADDKGFTVQGPGVPHVWVPRGQVHRDSEVEHDAGLGATGKLSVTEWFALSRNLKRSKQERKMMTGETMDVILDLVHHASELGMDERKELIDSLLNRLCVGCGSELGKYGPCPNCGKLRPDEQIPELDRLREENRVGGDLINEIATVLKAGNCERSSIMSAIERLRTQALRPDPKLTEGSAKSFIFELGKIFDVANHWGDVEGHRVLDVAKSFMNEIRFLRARR